MRLRGDSDSLLVAYQHGAASMKDRIRELEAALTEARMQSLADLGQAQDAYEAQKKAEAENVKLRDALMRVPFGKDELQRLGETEND